MKEGRERKEGKKGKKERKGKMRTNNGKEKGKKGQTTLEK